MIQFFFIKIEGIRVLSGFEPRFSPSFCQHPYDVRDSSCFLSNVPMFPTKPLDERLVFYLLGLLPFFILRSSDFFCVSIAVFLLDLIDLWNTIEFFLYSGKKESPITFCCAVAVQMILLLLHPNILH